MEQLKIVLFVSCYPRWPKQVPYWLSITLATLISMAQTGLFLLVPGCPRWSSYVQYCLSLTMATRGDTKQIEIVLFVSCYPRWPRQVQYWLSITLATLISMTPTGSFLLVPGCPRWSRYVQYPLTYLGQQEWHKGNIICAICVMLPKVTKASTVLFVTCHYNQLFHVKYQFLACTLNSNKHKVATVTYFVMLVI